MLVTQPLQRCLVETPHNHRAGGTSEALAQTIKEVGVLICEETASE